MSAKKLNGTLAIVSPLSSSTVQDPYVRISVGETHQLKSKAQTFRVVFGCAWVSYKGDDYVLKAGDELSFPAGRYEAYISPLGKQPAVYEVIQAQ